MQQPHLACAAYASRYQRRQLAGESLGTWLLEADTDTMVHTDEATTVPEDPTTQSPCATLISQEEKVSAPADILQAWVLAGADACAPLGFAPAQDHAPATGDPAAGKAASWLQEKVASLVSHYVTDARTSVHICVYVCVCVCTCVHALAAMALHGTRHRSCRHTHGHLLACAFCGLSSLSACLYTCSCVCCVCVLCVCVAVQIHWLFIEDFIIIE